MADAELLTALLEAVGRIALAIVGEQAAGVDAEPCEPGCGRVEEVGGGEFALVRVHGHEGDTRVIVDGDVQELGPDALDPVPAIAGDAVRWPLDFDQALDIEVQQIAGRRMFVAIGRQLRLQIADAVELKPAQDAAHRRWPQLEFLRDANPGPAQPTQRFHLSDPFLRRLARAPMWPGRTVSQSRGAIHPISPNPLGCTLPAELELGHGLVQAQPAL